MCVMSLYLHDKEESKTKTNPPTLDSALFQWYFLVLITTHKYVMHLSYFTLSVPEVFVLQQDRNSGPRTVSEILGFVWLLF